MSWRDRPRRRHVRRRGRARTDDDESESESESEDGVREYDAGNDATGTADADVDVGRRINLVFQAPNGERFTRGGDRTRDVLRASSTSGETGSSGPRWPWRWVRTR